MVTRFHSLEVFALIGIKLAILLVPFHRNEVSVLQNELQKVLIQSP